jgi:hypothetical protein
MARSFPQSMYDRKIDTDTEYEKMRTFLIQNFCQILLYTVHKKTYPNVVQLLIISSGPYKPDLPLRNTVNTGVSAAPSTQSNNLN